jgi:hypothetical protein
MNLWLDTTVNPFWSFNKIYVMYCDGASFSGTAGAVTQGGHKLYFAGKRIWQQVE